MILNLNYIRQKLDNWKAEIRYSIYLIGQKLHAFIHADLQHAFIQHAFIHADLPFALLLLSTLGACWRYFDFYDVIGLQCSSMFLPFALTDGLYESLSCWNFHCFFRFFSFLFLWWFQSCSYCPCCPNAFTHFVFAAAKSCCPSVPIEYSAYILPVATNIPPVSSLPEPSVSFSSRLTGAGLLLLHVHRHLGHCMTGFWNRRMIDCGMCGKLAWVPGIVIRDHCWDCLKGQQRRNVPAPDPNLRELHPLSCQILVWDWCGPQHVCALHGEFYSTW